MQGRTRPWAVKYWGPRGWFSSEEHHSDESDHEIATFQFYIQVNRISVRGRHKEGKTAVCSRVTTKVPYMQ